jgi:hypothetical protein
MLSVAAFVAATTRRWRSTATADTHFAIAELRHAISRMGAAITAAIRAG